MQRAAAPPSWLRSALASCGRLASQQQQQRALAKGAGRRPARQQQQQLVPKPTDEWTPVRDKQTGHTYYWNEGTGETTAVGEPRPGPGGRVQQYAQPPYGQVAGGGARSVGGQMVSLVATGAGIGLVFALLRHAF